MKNLMFFALLMLSIFSLTSCSEKRVQIVDNNGREYSVVIAPIMYDQMPDTGEVIVAFSSFATNYNYTYNDQQFNESDTVAPLWVRRKIVRGKVIAIKN